MKNKVTDIICLCLVAAFFGSLAIANIIQPERPTESLTEKRKLAVMPQFSVNSLVNGSYFKEISLFVSDTFIYRDQLVALSKKMDLLRGFNYSLGGDESFVLLDPTKKHDGDESDDISDRLNEAFDSLKNNEVSKEETKEITEKLTISKKTLKLTVGSGAALSVLSDDADFDPALAEWKVSDAAIASVSVKYDGSVDVKGISEGNCTVTCSHGGASVSCDVTVTAMNTSLSTSNDGHADFLTDGMFIYGDAVYTQGYYSPTNAETYAKTALYYKNLFGGDTRVSIVIAPVSSMVVDNPEVKAKIPDQKEILDKMSALTDPTVNFVDTYSEMYEHHDEYLFFRTDHHWTQRGAYYAYCAFARSVGFDPTSLEDFDYTLLNDSYSGSMYQYTYDERVKDFSDSIEAFVSKKPHTMTVTSQSGAVNTYDSSVLLGNNTYVAFIAGDNPCTIINVPDNPQDMTALVLKDSFGNAFVPFLCENYGNIIVVDVRYASFNIYEQFKDYDITDIIFVNNIQAANSNAWAKMYLRAVGVE